MDIRNFENTVSNATMTGDASTRDFISERARFITELHNHIPLMEREFQSLQDFMNERNESAFTKKCEGWSKLCNATEILYKMYIER